MFAPLDAPNTIDWICGWRQTYSMAARGSIAPDASTDIAISRQRRSRIVFSYSSIPPHIRKPILLKLAHTIGFSIPCPSRASSSRGRFIVMNPGSAPYLSRTWSEKKRNASCMPSPSSKSVTTFWMKMTGVDNPANIFILASTNSCMIGSMSLPARATPPLNIDRTAPSSGRNRRSASSMPNSVTALAYLCAYGMHG